MSAAQRSKPSLAADPSISAPRFTQFIAGLEHLLAQRPAEPRILEEGGRLLAQLVAQDDWLPAHLAVSRADAYRQVPLHRDAAGRFAVVAFVWGAGQGTPIHDHTVWGLIGMLRGAEYSQGYRFTGPDHLVPDGSPLRLEAGQVAAVSPSIGDVHRVRNAHDDSDSISIHVYGADIGIVPRSRYAEDGSRHAFVSGYSSTIASSP